MGLQEQASTLEKFVEFVEFLPLLGRESIFRGQAVKGQLIPGIARGKPNTDVLEAERGLIRQLELLGATFLSPPPQTSLDRLVLAQHFGLKTRLLDWTSNPLAALWFACTDRKEGDAYVYVLEIESRISREDIYSQDPYSQSATVVFQPHLNNARIIAQHGWFTLHGYSSENGGFIPLETELDSGIWAEIVIPATARPHLCASLERHGISRRTLFPDLEGLCTYLNGKYFTT